MRRLLYAILPLICAAPAVAAPSPTACATLEYRQFDFWIGNWRVTQPNGKLAGHNRIEKILGGCALQENWIGAGGSKGHSYNIYDAPRAVWHQTWVDNSGMVLLLDGGLKDGSMVLSGEQQTDKGPVLNRITWTPRPDGRVRQLWESSSDGGKTWQTAFDGLYAREPKRT